MVGTKDRLNMDISSLVGPLDQEEEPKTLEECLLEAGGFPFVARAVSEAVQRPEYQVRVLPVGQVGRFSKMSSNGYYLTDLTSENGNPLRLDPHVKRWVLLGHKT